eukprot:CAMPEP_0174380292 /NCGR_PEP_ID=MMETSP0811_2-20130205/123283_1 /TAXON_ID=73025 ORGANISM="Eutreptiella gymnastica-like, Strain CCMP1594" /NCGR_SAMPLE_ID=MMETSP0811_2 /ASSEMBLY_ACC=CAM_ASM_000667 /LENGTH=195 /DNA_ID=CAMNT_0015533121 /DNA_START=340 /DNA_END=925 /DNA_ORIENTATION=+
MGPDGGDAARAAGACGSEGTTHTGRRARANHGHTGGMRGRTVPGAVPLGHCFAVAASGWPNGMVPALRPVCGGVHEGTTPPSPFDLRTTTALRDRAPAQRYSLPSGRRRLAPNSRFGCRGQAKVFSFPLTWTALVGGCAVGVQALCGAVPLHWSCLRFFICMTVQDGLVDPEAGTEAGLEVDWKWSRGALEAWAW